MTNDEVREALDAELLRQVDPYDRVAVTVRSFRDFELLSPGDEFMSDPATIRSALMVRFWRYIDGRKFQAISNVQPLVVSDSLALPTIAQALVHGWERQRDEAIRTGPPALPD